MQFEGVHNLRDLGGYTTADGRIVREGCLFRSDELHWLTERDLDDFSALGVRVVYDLRNHSERELRPNPTLADVVVHERQAPPSDGGSITFEEQIAAGNLPPQADDEEFGDVYIALLTHLRGELGHIVELASDANEKPLLFHCAAGKDRTGITAAVLLGLLGVDDETILDDYELTTKLWTPKRMEQLGDLIAEHDLDVDNLRRIVSARRPVLAKALRYLHDTWATFDAYAMDALSVSPETIDRLRTNLLT
ncbi:MAG: protein-tyrosine phosphatase [Actinomycetota bacterium]|jgi:protein-tyrosine phosphatase